MTPAVACRRELSSRSGGGAARRRRASTAAAAAWGAVQLPGEGITALAATVAASALALLVLAGRVAGVGEAVRQGLPAAAVTLLAAPIPFIVEARFGVLGTGFNVDMSQHLFAADWLGDPGGPPPGP